MNARVTSILAGIAVFVSLASAAPVKVFFDTDMETDCDDAGALAVLHTLADRGECEILATVTSVRDVNSIATVDAINRYRGRPVLPLGMVHGAGVLEKSKFAGSIAKEFPHRVQAAAEIAESVLVYRDVLEKQADHSVVIVTVGYLTNLKNLLQLPASDSHASGLDLIQSKVARWVCMGGNFIGSPPKDDLKLGNVNFQRDATSAHFVIHHWPGEIDFAGREVCSVPSGLQIGKELATTPADNPVRRAYEHYFGGEAKNRHVADLATVLFAVRGLSDCWDISEPGRMELKEDMSFEWQFTTEGKQRYLLKKPNNDRHVEAVLNELLIASPQSTAVSPFGIGACHTNSRSAKDLARWIPQMESIGLHELRSVATSWGAVELKRGAFDWKNLDEQLNYLTQHRITTGGLLLGSPAWNKLDKPGTLPVNNLEGWSNYVSKIVQHAKGRIHRWEVWNEPPNFTGKDQTPADYAKLVVAAFNAAKAADPSCLIGLAAKSAHVNYLEQVIKAGAKDHFDYITLHPYEVLDGIAENKGTEPVFMNIVPVVRKMLAAQNPAKADVPIIFTELGCDAKQKGEDTQAHALAKAYTMGIAQGVQCIQWFEGMDGDSGPMGLMDGKAQPRPSYTALAKMIEHLGQHPQYLGWTMLNEKHYAFVFQGAKSNVLIAWSHSKTPDDIQFSKSVRWVNPLTGDVKVGARHALTIEPIIALDVPDDLVTQAKANRTKPLPWGGVYSQAKSVSITMEGAHQEHGLHTLSSEALAKAVVAYGGSARAGNVPGGNLFIVDPSFLSYTSEPIEITVVVRRNEANDNAGFKLLYESTSGFKTAKPGWFTVPDNKQWHTIRYQIDDAQFVNYWGYNFSLVSDGNVFNKYYLQSVTVTKRGR